MQQSWRLIKYRSVVVSTQIAKEMKTHMVAIQERKVADRRVAWVEIAEDKAADNEEDDPDRPAKRARVD